MNFPPVPSGPLAVAHIGTRWWVYCSENAIDRPFIDYKEYGRAPTVVGMPGVCPTCARKFRERRVHTECFGAERENYARRHW